MEASPTYEPLAQHPVATRLLTAQPDAVLCRLAARGNIGAYDALYQRYRQPIFAFVFHLIGRPDATEDAEDIAQDAFTRAFAGIREKNIDGSFRGWLYTIARNRTFDVLRARKQNVVSLDADAAEPPAAPPGAGPAERAEQRAEFAWLMTAVADLPERQRDALLLREMGGLSYERIAEQLGTSVSATKKLISRGRDGIGVAAAADGYGRVARRRLGHDLAMAAPIIPIGATLATLGISAGAGTAAASGAIIGGKTAATALTVLAIGGGAVAVEQKAVHSNDPAPQTSAQSRLGGTAAGGDPGSAPAVGVREPAGLRSDDGRRGRGDSRDDSEQQEDRRGRSPESGNGRGESGSGRRSEDSPRGGREDRGGERSGRGGSGSGRGSNSGPGGGDDDLTPEPSEPEVEDDHSGSDSGSNESSNSGPGSDSSPELDED